MNIISILTREDGVFLPELGEVKVEVVRYFSSLFSSTQRHVPLDEDLIRSVIRSFVSVDQAQRFTMSVTVDEIKCAMFELGRHKALGTDGYSMEFFRASWG